MQKQKSWSDYAKLSANPSISEQMYCLHTFEMHRPYQEASDKSLHFIDNFGLLPKNKHRRIAN